METKRFDEIARQCPVLFRPKILTDNRGIFFESWNDRRYREQGIIGPLDHFSQDNVSVSRKGVVRGLHYQVPPFAQGKLVQVLRGKAIDVAVDIRTGSPTFGAYIAVELSSENHHQLWIPVGFAHGFMALEDDTIFTYKVTTPYHPESERGILWNDPTIGIAWPTDVDPIVSNKDVGLPLLHEIVDGFAFGDY